MLYYLLFPLVKLFSILNLFRYITFRSVCAALTAFLICLLVGSKFIKLLKRKGIGESIRDDGPDRHLEKAGTPTMGGIIILTAILSSVFLWVRWWDYWSVWVMLFALLWFGVLGFWDDYIKMYAKKSKGLSPKKKLVVQIIGALIIMVLIKIFSGEWLYATAINIPFLKQPLMLPWGIYVLFGLLVIIGSSNAVNLTDGLDGLAIGSLALVSGTFTIMSYVVANFKFTEYLKIIYIPGAGELAVICAALVGAALGFLWFNAHPAEIFMGDTGSLSLGGALGTIAVLIKQEILLFVVGGIFVAEALSVILQVSFFKLRGKRIFLMAPLHHHFEMKGWSEPKIIIRFWIIAAMLAVITLITLKLR